MFSSCTPVVLGSVTVCTEETTLHGLVPLASSPLSALKFLATANDGGIEPFRQEQDAGPAHQGLTAGQGGGCAWGGVSGLSWSPCNPHA